MIPGQVLLQDPVNWQHPLSRGLTSWWLPLPGGSRGLRLRDLCRRHHGALTNFAAPMTSTSGWVGGSGNGFQALAFDGTDDQVSVADAPDLDVTTGPFTYHVAYNTVARSQYDGLIVKGSLQPQFLFGDTAGFSLWLGGSSNVFNNQGVVTNGVWQTVTLTRSGTSFILYQNGRQVYSTTSATSFTANTAELWIGRDYFTGFGREFNGRIGDVAIYATALSPASVFERHRQWKLGFPDLLRRVRPVAYFVPGDTPPPPSDDYHVTRYTQADLHRAVGSGVY